MYIRENDESEYDKVETINDFSAFRKLYFKNGSDNSYKDNYSASIHYKKDDEKIYIWIKDGKFYRKNGPAFIKINTKTGLPIKVAYFDCTNEIVIKNKKYSIDFIKFDENSKIIKKKIFGIEDDEEFKNILLEEEFKKKYLNIFKKDNKIKIENNIIKIKCNENNFDKIINMLSDKIHIKMFNSNGFYFDFAKRKLNKEEHLGVYAGVRKELSHEIGIKVKNNKTEDFLNLFIDKFINNF